MGVAPASRRCVYRVLGRALILAAAVGACEEPPAGRGSAALNADAPDKLGFIAFLGAGEGDPLWPLLKTSAQAYARLTRDLDVRFYLPAGRSPREQLTALQALQDPEMGGLCIHALDVTPLEPALDEMFNRGIRIVSMIQPLPERYQAPHVGFDESAVGRALAQATVDVFHDAGSIMVLHAGVDHPAYSPRLIAFEKTLDRHEGIEVFASVDCGRDPRRARTILQDRTARFPRLSAWVCLDDWPLRDLGIHDGAFDPGCSLITFGGTPAHWRLIEQGISPAIVAANYGDLGAEAIEFCEAALRHPTTRRDRYNAPLRVILPTNLEQYKRDWTFWSTGKAPQPLLPRTTP